MVYCDADFLPLIFILVRAEKCEAIANSFSMFFWIPAMRRISSATVRFEIIWDPNLKPKLLFSKVHKRGAIKIINIVGEMISPCLVPLSKGIDFVGPSAVLILVEE